MADPMIRLRGVTKTFPGMDRPAVEPLDLDVEDGEFVVFVGPSGCGKTTTLKMINRLVEPTAGTIEIAGRDVTDLPAPELRRDIGYVIQQIGLFPHRTIAQNIATVPDLLGWESGRTDARVAELLEAMSLDRELLDRYPAELSGGQRQRVGVARALAADPPVLLMDEPFGAVDPIVRHRLQREFLELQERLRKTICFVTHDIDEAIQLGDRIAIFNVGGILEQYGTPEDILREPASAFVEDFLGGERGLKRLSLRTVDDLARLHRGPVVTADASVDEARAVASSAGLDWVGVLDDDRLSGWVWVADLTGTGRVGDVTPRPFRVSIPCDASLRTALDALVRSRTGVATVHEADGSYAGMVRLEDLNAEITS